LIRIKFSHTKNKTPNPPLESVKENSKESITQYQHSPHTFPLINYNISTISHVIFYPDSPSYQYYHFQFFITLLLSLEYKQTKKKHRSNQIDVFSLKFSSEYINLFDFFPPSYIRDQIINLLLTCRLKRKEIICNQKKEEKGNN